MSTSRAAAHFPVGHARRGLQHQQPLRLGMVPLSPRFFGVSFFVAMQSSPEMKKARRVRAGLEGLKVSRWLCGLPSRHPQALASPGAGSVPHFWAGCQDLASIWYRFHQIRSPNKCRSADSRAGTPSSRSWCPMDCRRGTYSTDSTARSESGTRTSAL